MKKSIRAAVVASISAAALVFSASMSSAAVTRLVDDERGDWFVGKGDVQSAFGWDAKTTDSNFAKVVFSYKKTVETTFDCVNGSGNNATYVSNETTEQATSRITDLETRTGKKGTATTITGAFVTLTGTPTKTGSTPSCPVGSVQNSSKTTITYEELFTSLTTTVTTRKGTTTTEDVRLIWTAGDTTVEP